jgi:hypothetical protein
VNEIDEKFKLPCDVKIGHITFRAGVTLETLRLAAERWFKIARELNAEKKTK